MYTKLKSNEVVKDVAESEECKVLKIFGDEERTKMDRDLGESEECKVLNSLGGKVVLENEDILEMGSVVDMYEEVQVPFVKRELSGNVVSPDKTLMVTSCFPEKEEGMKEKNKVSVQLQRKDFLVSPSVSPLQLENCGQLISDSLEDEVKFNDERLKEEDKCGDYISATQSGGGAKSSRSKKQLAKAAGSRQSTLQLSLPSR